MAAVFFSEKTSKIKIPRHWVKYTQASLFNVIVNIRWHFGQQKTHLPQADI